jgi:DNA-damage-inducible protein J
MAKTAFLNARIDPDLKTKAEKVLAGVGVSASQAITMFYRQVVLRRGLPFDVCIPNAETLAALKEADAGGGQIVSGSTESAFEDILDEK